MQLMFAKELLQVQIRLEEGQVQHLLNTTYDETEFKKVHKQYVNDVY